MLYRGKDHKELFEKAVTARNIRSSEFLTALYLLTADNTLWTKVKLMVSSSSIYFSNIRLQNCSPDAYVLFMIAKDLYSGSRHMTIADMADRRLIDDRLFSVICNAVTLRRYGMKALKLAEKEG